MEGNDIITAAEIQPGVRNKAWEHLFTVHLQSPDLKSMSTIASTETKKRMKSPRAICHLSPSQDEIFEILSNIYFFI